jgi:hypothetical protein
LDAVVVAAVVVVAVVPTIQVQAAILHDDPDGSPPSLARKLKTTRRKGKAA